MSDYDAINLFRNLGMNIDSDAEYSVPLSSEMTIRGNKLVDYHPSVPQGNMTKVIVPSGIEVIGSNCFTGPDITHNDYMAGCRLPEGVTELEDEAFALCRGLKEISVPKTLKKIGNQVFMYSSIESIDLPEGLESIGDGAFMNCRCLKELRIPSTVTSIGEYCFSSMGTSLLSVMYGGDDGGTVYLPSSLKEEYTEEYFASGNLKIKWYEGGKKKYTPALPTKVFRYDEKVSFELPEGYEAVKEKDENGNEAFHIRSHPFTDDDGEERYRFACQILEGNADPESIPKGKKYSAREFLENTVKGADGIHYFLLPGSSPAAVMLCNVPNASTDDDNPAAKLANLFVMLSRPFLLDLRIAVGELSTIECICTGSAGMNDDPNYMPQFEGMVTVARAVRINGKPLQTGGLTHRILERAFSPRTISYQTTEDISSKMKSVFSNDTVSIAAPGKSAAPLQKNDPNFVMDGTVLKQYKGSAKDVVLPGGLTAVAEKAFTRKKIRSVHIPEGVTAVGEDAFEGCYEMEEATLPSTLRELGSSAFKGCHKLKHVTLRGSLTEIDSFTFYGCYELENIDIPWTVEKIGIYAFEECKRLTSVVIPERVKTIGKSAFQDCKNLSYLFIPASVTELGVSSYDNGTPFTGSRKLTIHCPAGSYAEKFCKSHGLKYVTESRPKSPQELKKLYPAPPSKTAEKKAPDSAGQPAANPIGFPIAEPEASQRRLLDRKPKKTDSPNRFDLAFASMTGDPYYEDALRRFYPDQFGSREFWSKIESLLKATDGLVTVFRNDGEAVDRETELRNGLIRKAYTLHVFKSFLWTSGEYCRQNKMEYDAFGFDRTLELAQFIYDRGGVNWKPVDKQAKRFGALLLKKAEKEYWFDKEDVESLTEFLLSLEPLMREAYEYLNERSNQFTDADRTLAEILAGWCAFSFACYYGQIRAIGGPEDLVPEKRRTLPEAKLDVLNQYYYVTPGGTCVACKDPGTTIEFPEGIKRVLIPLLERGVSGAEEYYYHAKKVVFPKSCNEPVLPKPPRTAKEAVFKADYELIEPGAWHDPSYWENPKGKELALEKLSFLGSAARLKDYALSHMQNLRELKLPENIREFGWMSVAYTPSLKEIVLPPTVETVDRNVFCESYEWEQSNKRTIIVEKGSRSEETLKKYAADKKYLVIKVIPSREEQARIAEENRLKAVAESLKRALTDAYRDDLEEGTFDSLKSRIGESFSRVCDRKTWAELRRHGIPAIPSSNLSETNRKIASSASPEEAYDQLPEWIAAEYIKAAEENRKAAEEKRSRQAFAGVLKELTSLSRESIREDFENGVEKNEYLGAVVSRAKALINDSEQFAANLKKYDGMTELETLRYYIGRRTLDSVNSLIDAIADKKESEYDRLTALLEKKNASLEAIRKEEEQLKEERARLGLLQVKRKKEIAALLEQIPERIRQAEQEYDYAKKSY